MTEEEGEAIEELRGIYKEIAPNMELTRGDIHKARIYFPDHAKPYPQYTMKHFPGAELILISNSREPSVELLYRETENGIYNIYIYNI